MKVLNSYEKRKLQEGWDAVSFFIYFRIKSIFSIQRLFGISFF